MGSWLLIDIGAGTMDILCYDGDTNGQYKAVARSPVLCVAREAANLTGDVLVTGSEMGGGSVSRVLRDRADRGRVVMSESASATINHDPDRVRSWGIEVVSDGEADDLMHGGGFSHLSLGDLDRDRIRRIVEGLGVDFEFDVVGVCVQDHGVPPCGVSHLDYRHGIFKSRLDEAPFPHTLLFEGREVPATFNRLTAVASAAASFPTREVYVMDSGMAAVLGATMDRAARECARLLVLDMATSHTVGAAFDEGELAGFFEYHTADMTPRLLRQLMVQLAEGRLDHARIVSEGGHGAYVRKAFGFRAAQAVIATGPKRKLAEDSGLEVVWGAPLGDNMMTGTAGLMEAVRRRKGA